VLPSEPTQVREPSPKGPSLDDASELKQMLAGIMAAIQQNTKLQELSANQDSVRANNKRIQQFQDSVRADLSANQERVMADINSIRNDIKAENVKLIKKSELQSQQAK
jgi:ABC-type uncharacterized transport system fused permease/ATPase subunit